MRLATPFIASVLVLATAPTHAESWCATPLVVHEWGVLVHGRDGTPTLTPDLPDFFHTPTRRAAAKAPIAVRDLPADSGVRTLPVLHFYAPAGGMGGPTIPVAIEVGFTTGDAAAWYPEVDRLRTFGEAYSWGSLMEGGLLDAARAVRRSQPYFGRDPAAGPEAARLALPDPRRQLAWERLDLTRAPPAAPAAAVTDSDWVRRARALDALWVAGASETERFVFYEGETKDPVPLVVQRGPGWTPERRQYVLENRGRGPVHDVFVVHREGKDTFVFELPTLPAKKRATFTLEDHRVTDVPAATSARLRTLLVDAASPAPPDAHHWGGECVMGRDPALPFERADGHRLYAAEVDLLMSVWADRFFGQAGTTILYREDVAELDRVMPLALFTDMYHHIQIRRAGLALWEGVALP